MKPAENMTRLTVLYTVHNGAAFVRESVQSILDQTYSDFRFLILDDASTDGTQEIIRSFRDPRINLVELQHNIGQTAALNLGIERSDTPYIARMDADDISLPKRFERQVDFMDRHPDIGISGTFVIRFSRNGSERKSYPSSPEDVKAKLLFGCCLAHPSVIIRKSCLDKHGLAYDEKLGHSEDWDLWLRSSNLFSLANLPEYLLRYRVHSDSVTSTNPVLLRKTAGILTDRVFKILELSDSPLKPIHLEIAQATFDFINKNRECLPRVLEWYDQLRAANEQHRIYAPRSLEKTLDESLWAVLNNNPHWGGPAVRLMFQHKLYRRAGIHRFIKLFFKTLGPHGKH